MTLLDFLSNLFRKEEIKRNKREEVKDSDNKQNEEIKRLNERLLKEVTRVTYK
jgi:hypothetical protein